MSASSGPQSAVGVDVIEIGRVEAALGRFGERFLRRVYTREEAAFCRGRVHELAARFAAKEAVMKALGTGAKGGAWRGIGLEGLDVSMSHSREYAVAFVVGQSRDLEPDRPGWRRKLIGILRERGLLGEGGGTNR